MGRAVAFSVSGSMAAILFGEYCGGFEFPPSVQVILEEIIIGVKTRYHERRPQLRFIGCHGDRLASTPRKLITYEQIVSMATTKASVRECLFCCRILHPTRVRQRGKSDEHIIAKWLMDHLGVRD